MFLSRRKFLNYINCTGLTAISTPLFGSIQSSDNHHLLNYFKFSVGEIKITVVSDGGFQLPISSIDINSSEENLKKHLKHYHMQEDHIYMNTNLAVIEVEDKKLLIDVGSGSRFIGNTGKLFDNLSKANIDPESITNVFLTHAHPDHILGIRDDFDETIFPDAEFMISEKEYGWWTKKNRVSEVDETFMQMVLWAQNSLNAIPEISLFKKNEFIKKWEISKVKGKFQGTGCSMSSFIASNLAKGLRMQESIELAQNSVYQSLQNAIDLGSGQKIPKRFK